MKEDLELNGVLVSEEDARAYEIEFITAMAQDESVFYEEYEEDCSGYGYLDSLEG